jgi:RNase P subunit RPR2
MKPLNRSTLDRQYVHTIGEIPEEERATLWRLTVSCKRCDSLSTICQYDPFTGVLTMTCSNCGGGLTGIQVAP